MRPPLTLLLLAATGQVEAHYRFSRLVINSTTDATEWLHIRQTKNYQDDHGVTDVSSSDIRCFQMKPGTGTASVVAGTDLGFVADQGFTHPGPVQFYMARLPSSISNINTWDPGSSKVWFKVASINGVNPGGKQNGFSWPTYNKKTVSFTVPKGLPNGKYLVRVESIALHQAQQAGGAQFYLACAQVEVVGGIEGGEGNLGRAEMVAFPGAYRAGEKGLIFSWQTTSYEPPGPAVWEARP